MSNTQEADALMSIPRTKEVMLWMGGNGNEMYIIGGLKDSEHNTGALVLTIICFFSYGFV